MIDWSSIPFVRKFISKEMVVMSLLDSLKATIEEALELGTQIKDDAEDRAQRLNEVVSELETINGDLEENKNALDSIQDNLDALETQKNDAEDLGVYI